MRAIKQILWAYLLIICFTTMVDASATFNFVQEPNSINPVPIPGITGIMTITDASRSAGVVTKNDIINFRFTVSNIGTREYPGDDLSLLYYYEKIFLNEPGGNEILGPSSISLVNLYTTTHPELYGIEGYYYSGYWTFVAWGITASDEDFYQRLYGKWLIDDSQSNDSDQDGVIDDEDNCPETSNPGQIDSDDDGVGDACEPSTDLSISKVDLVQAVFDPDIEKDGRLDLVLDRQTALIVTVIANDLATETVVIKARLGEQVIPSESVVLSTTGTEGTKVPIFFTPVEPGNHDLIVEIDPDNHIEEMDDKINNLESKKVTVRATKDLVIPYVFISSCDGPEPCYGSLDPETVNKHITNSNTFLQATYPVPDDGIISGIAGGINGDPSRVPKGPSITTGLYNDLINVIQIGKLHSNGFAKRMVGIVPEGYFLYHGLGCNKGGAITDTDKVEGVGNPYLQGVLVKEGFWTAAAHEIGHTFYLDDEYGTPNADCTVADPGITVDGYWVAKQKHVKDAKGFMGTAPEEGELFPDGSDQPPNRWVTKDNWYKLMRALDSERPDPELLLISGLIDLDGTVKLYRWLTLPKGVPDFPETGSYTIRLSDQAGATLLTAPFDISFSLNVDPFGTIESDVAPFFVAIPYPVETAAVSIEGPEGVPLVHVFPTSKVLRDAIQSIPDQCFVKNSSQRRNALENKVEAIQNMLENGNKDAAISKLEKDILKHLESWLIDGCEKETPLEMTKQDVLGIVDDTIQRLMLRPFNEDK